jgi:hypothetical protein
MAQEIIAAAGNTEVPAYLTLIELGYSVDRVDKGGEEHWIAKKGTLELVADGPLELLGLCLLRSERGARWQAADNEIDGFLKRFYPSDR